MARKQVPSLDMKTFLTKALRNESSKQYRERQTVFSQGDPADAVFFIEAGKVQVAVRSKQRKEAVIAILEPGSFFGEECMVAGQSCRLATASCLESSDLLRIKKETLVRLLKDARFSDRFTSYLLSRNLRIQEDLIDQLFTSAFVAVALRQGRQTGTSDSPGQPANYGRHGGHNPLPRQLLLE